MEHSGQLPVSRGINSAFNQAPRWPRLIQSAGEIVPSEEEALQSKIFY